jgi:maltose alpha-D-glucosyltransferase / alpha-amylase
MDRAEAKDATGLDAWENEVRRAFLGAYAEVSGISLQDSSGLLRLFELEKVLYELRYEINNRPAWIHVPLSGVIGMLGGAR